MSDPMVPDDAEPDSPAYPRSSFAPADSLTLDIDMRASDWQPFISDIEAHIGFLAAALALPPVELSLVLGDDALLAELNETYRGKRGPTNVLSFPALDMPAAMARLTGATGKAGKTGDRIAALLPGALLGDIVLSFDTLAREAQAGGKSLTAHALHLVTHGVLHLLGHDHTDDGEAAMMEALESRLLLAAGLDDPYAEVAR